MNQVQDRLYSYQVKYLEICLTVINIQCSELEFQEKSRSCKTCSHFIKYKKCTFVITQSQDQGFALIIHANVPG
jgi:hypothetical protein